MPSDARAVARVAFATHSRAAYSGAGQGQGLGFGLYICSQIVRAHGGTLDATSDATDGTRFTARVPIEKLD